MLTVSVSPCLRGNTRVGLVTHAGTGSIRYTQSAPGARIRLTHLFLLVVVKCKASVNHSCGASNVSYDAVRSSDIIGLSTNRVAKLKYVVNAAAEW